MKRLKSKYDSASDRPEAAKTPQESDLQRLIGIGDVHLGADNIVSAMEYYERALAIARDVEIDAEDRLEIELRIVDASIRGGRHLEALGFIESVLERIGSDPDPRPRARVVARLGMVQNVLHRYEVARASCLEAYEVLRKTDANRDVGMLELTLGAIEHYSGRAHEARTHYESALSTFRRIDDSEGITRALNNLGTLLINTPRWREGKEYLTRAIAVAEETGSYARIATLCLNLGIIAYKTAEWDLSSTYFSRALAISRETAPSRMIRAHIGFGRLKLRMGDLAAAESHFQQILESAREGGYPREEALAYEFLGEKALREGDLSRAEPLLHQALDLARKVAPENDVVGEVQTRLAELWLQRGDGSRALAFAEAAEAVANKVGDAVERGRAFRLQGESHRTLGNAAEARSCFDQAVRVLEGTPDVIEIELARIARAKEGGGATAASGLDDQGSIVALQQASVRLLDFNLPALAVSCLLDLASLQQSQNAIDEALATLDRATELAGRTGSPGQQEAIARMRTALEERCAETSLTRSAEFQLLREATGYGSRDPETVISAYLELACQRAEADRAALAIRERDGGLRIESSRGFVRGALPKKAMLVGLFEEVVRGRRILILGDSRVAIPVDLADEAAGILYVERGVEGQANRFQSADLKLLAFFAGILGVFLSAREVERRRSAERQVEVAEPGDALSRFLTCSAEMKQSMSLLRKLDRSDSGVLVTGETGTGKGLLARLIHESSSRSRGPFVPVNCAALPESLLESELFGHEQGAFTGAVRRKRGLFEEAEGGTLFLDEVDKAPRGVQGKLLHVLDRHEIRPVGATQWKPVDVRVICATNVDLRQAIEESLFLEDLYYRLNDFQVHIPPLRERREDIPLLVRHFVREFGKTLGREGTEFTREAIQELTDCEWRGNVRELEKVVKRVLVLAEDGEQIGASALPREVRRDDRSRVGANPDSTLKAAVQKVEAEMIGAALQAAGGNKSEVARRLRVSYPCLLSKIKQYGLEPHRD